MAGGREPLCRPATEGRRPLALLIALGTALVVAIAAIVVLLSRDDRPDDAAARSSQPGATADEATATTADDSPATDLSTGQITASLLAIGMQTKGSRINMLVLHDEGTSRFSVCNGDSQVKHYAMDPHGATSDDGSDDQPCYAVFEVSDLDAGDLAALAEKHAEGDAPLDLVIDSWNTYTPTVAVEVDTGASERQYWEYVGTPVLIGAATGDQPGEVLARDANLTPYLQPPAQAAAALCPADVSGVCLSADPGRGTVVEYYTGAPSDDPGPPMPRSWREGPAVVTLPDGSVIATG